VSGLIGRKLGQYEVVELLGKGGMATVYKGYQESIDRYVAIKVLPPHPGLDEQFIQRFQLEAKTIGGLQHPHILSLYDYGNEDDIIYLVMQYADGGTLGDLMIKGQPMNIKQAERFIRESASALDYAHRRDVVHRDVKPANILLDSEKHVFLADFGIVKMMSSGSNLTGTGIVGTPAYIAPEQGQGLSIDGRADVYSLGCMAFEMFTGRQPYQSDSPMQLIIKHMNEPTPDIIEFNPELNDAVNRVFKKVMAKDPDQRYQTATDFAEDLTSALHNNDESIIAVRAEVPLEDNQQRPISESNQPTIQQNTLADYGFDPTNPTNPPPTVILRESTNPLIILGGFGIIAVMVVIIAFLLISSQNDSETDNENVVAIDATAEIIEPTDIPSTPIPTVPTFGEIRYSTIDDLGDTVTVRLEGVAPLAEGEYVGWLKNTGSGNVLMLGTINIDSLGEGTLVYSDEERRNLPASFNAILITVETEMGDMHSDEVAYSGFVPLDVTNSLNSILVTAETGINGAGFLESALIETNFAIQHAGLAARATNVGGLRTHGEHTLNILNGEQEDYNGDGRGSNPGRGFGVYVFFDAIKDSLNNVIMMAPENINLQNNSEFIRVCVVNARNWADEVAELELTLIAAETVEEVEEEATRSTERASYMRDGFDQNENGTIEPFEGECGLTQIEEFSVLFGNVALQEGNIIDG